MPTKPTFDVLEAHKYFSATCFNKAWDFIEKKDRSADGDRQMVALNCVSTYH